MYRPYPCCWLPDGPAFPTVITAAPVMSHELIRSVIRGKQVPLLAAARSRGKKTVRAGRASPPPFSEPSAGRLGQASQLAAVAVHTRGSGRLGSLGGAQGRTTGLTDTPSQAPPCWGGLDAVYTGDHMLVHLGVFVPGPGRGDTCRNKPWPCSPPPPRKFSEGHPGR